MMSRIKELRIAKTRFLMKAMTRPKTYNRQPMFSKMSSRDLRPNKTFRWPSKFYNLRRVTSKVDLWWTKNLHNLRETKTDLLNISEATLKSLTSIISTKKLKFYIIKEKEAIKFKSHEDTRETKKLSILFKEKENILNIWQRKVWLPKKEVGVSKRRSSRRKGRGNGMSKKANRSFKCQRKSEKMVQTEEALSEWRR